MRRRGAQLRVEGIHNHKENRNTNLIRRSTKLWKRGTQLYRKWYVGFRKRGKQFWEKGVHSFEKKGYKATSRRGTQLSKKCDTAFSIFSLNSIPCPAPITSFHTLYCSLSHISFHFILVWTFLLILNSWYHIHISPIDMLILMIFYDSNVFFISICSIYFELCETS